MHASSSPAPPRVGRRSMLHRRATTCLSFPLSASRPNSLAEDRAASLIVEVSFTSWLTPSERRTMSRFTKPNQELLQALGGIASDLLRRGSFDFIIFQIDQCLQHEACSRTMKGIQQGNASD
jgi:hypothetical protein